MSCTQFAYVRRTMRRRVRRYRKDVQRWKADHDVAVECMDFEVLLQHGLSVYEAINLIDENWRRRVLCGQIDYDPDIAAIIDDLYKWWSAPCSSVLSTIEKFEQQGYTVSQAEDFRRACREVKGILTDDADFFVSESLVIARDNAIDAHREGQCDLWPE